MYRPIIQEDVFLRAHRKQGSPAHIWFLHGFGESSLSFREVFSSELAASYSLFAPDLPGFGVSPPQPGKMSLKAATRVTIDLINVLSSSRPVLLVGHSLGSVIATWVARELGEIVKGVFSIEGNLTRSDGYFSALAAKFEQADTFYRYFLDLIYERTAQSEVYQRYFASVRFASPQAMMAWGRSSAQLGESGTHGSDFAALECAKLYYWGTESTPEETRKFIAARNIPNRKYTGNGHWPMVETPDACYHHMGEFFKGLKL
ncbi:MAG: alpha/beta hydrolase [Desulfobacterales bacterium]|jgi:pimeloyl-ACP methyl ester carboxylesterase